MLTSNQSGLDQVISNLQGLANLGGTPYYIELIQVCVSQLYEDKKYIQRLEEEIEIDNKLIAERSRVLEAIPECTAHGSNCVPNALSWIKAHK